MREHVECTQEVPHEIKEEAGVLTQTLGDAVERLPGCGVGGMLAKALASPEGTSNCLMAIWTGWVFFLSGFWHSPYV